MKKSISMLLLLTLVLMLLVPDISWAQQNRRDKYSLAVLNPGTVGGEMSATDARLLTDRLTDEMNSAGVFHVMSQTDMERGLFAKNLDPSGCTSIECGVRAGAALGVQLVVIGIITQTTMDYAVDLKMIHVASKTIVKEYRGNIEGSLNDLYANMGFIARELMGLSRSTSSSQAGSPVSRPVTPERMPTSEQFPEQDYYNNGGGFKWTYVGIGLLIAGGVGAGVLISQGSGGGSNGSDTTPPGSVDDLPGPPKFP